MTVGLDSALGIRISLNADELAVAAALAELVETGLVRVDESGDGYVLTQAGIERAQASLVPGSSAASPDGQRWVESRKPRWVLRPR